MDMYRRGFTIIELSLVIGVTAILFSVGSIIHLSAEPSVQLSTSVDLFTSDAKQQQIKAMSGLQGVGLLRIHRVYTSVKRLIHSFGVLHLTR